MAQTTNSTGDFMTVRNPYNLQTQQKRVRHLRSISVRNLHSGAPGNKPLSRLQCYFTLHTHVDAQAFYESEKITGSTNPSWQSFDISQFEDEINLASKFIVVRVWAGQQDNYHLLIVMEVHLSGLHFLTEKLQQLVVKQSPNMVIFGMLDKEFIFVNKEQNRIRNLAKRVSDLELPSTLLPAVVKVEKANVRNTYTTSALCRIQTVLRAIKQMQTHARRYRRQIEDKLLESQENSQKLEERENLQMSVSQLRQELLRRSTHLHQCQEKLLALKEATTSRENALQSDTQQLTNHMQLLKEDNRDHIVKREQLVKENALLNLRRKQMLNELFSYIYPITEEKHRYFINSVRLPHAEELQGQDETMIAVGLGYSCHLTLKVAQIQGLPLRHPMENRGSKSVIYDQVHSKLADKDREFPLYSKGRDKNHFNYGVFLLNKNISQLRYQCSMPTLDLRQTLQNLLTLMHKLGVRLEGDTTVVPPTLTSTPEGTALSRPSPNGSSSITTNLTPSFLSPSANGDLIKAQDSTAHNQHSKTSDFSEGSTGQSTTADKSSGKARDAGGEHFDEAEDIFKPAGDDHFFRVRRSFMEEFNASAGEEGERHGLTDLQAGGEEGDDSQRVSALLQTASEGRALTPKTFQLLKGKRPGSRRAGGGEWNDNNSGGENGVDADAENSDDEDVRAGGGEEVRVGGVLSHDPDLNGGGRRNSGSDGEEDSPRVGGDDSGIVAHSQASSGPSGHNAGGVRQECFADDLLLTEDG
ncbi:UV radiation resistance-associated gene protein-like [Babylonia areolata]|uniref:UV radiation resistance-associated gene protein-like n=1 Tax=Babylonia areolata TaxID=304850 RepID=UPI003FD59B5D